MKSFARFFSWLAYFLALAFLGVLALMPQLDESLGRLGIWSSIGTIWFCAMVGGALSAGYSQHSRHTGRWIVNALALAFLWFASSVYLVTTFASVFGETAAQ